jgi:hypothetical protein
VPGTLGHGSTGDVNERGGHEGRDGHT